MQRAVSVEGRIQVRQRDFQNLGEVEEFRVASPHLLIQVQ